MSFRKLFFIVFFFLALLPLDPLAQPGPGDPPPIPLDGGLLWLLLAGAGYGVKKIVDHKKKQKDQ